MGPKVEKNIYIEMKSDLKFSLAKSDIDLSGFAKT